MTEVVAKCHAMFTQTEGARARNLKAAIVNPCRFVCDAFFLSPVKQVARLRLSLFSNMSMKAVKMLDYGDSSNLSYEDAPIPEPGKGEVIIHSYILDITDGH